MGERGYLRGEAMPLNWSTRDDANDFTPESMPLLAEMLGEDASVTESEQELKESLQEPRGTAVLHPHGEAVTLVKTMKTKPILEAEEPSVIPESACFVEQIATDWSPELLAKLAEIPWLVNVVEWLPEPKQYLQELPERVQQISTSQLVTCSAGLYVATHLMQRRLRKPR